MTSRKHQLNLPGFNSNTSHGGEKALGKRKEARPIRAKSPMHICLKSVAARGELSLFFYRKFIESLFQSLGKKFQVQVIEYANVGNHLHLILKSQTRDGFKNFLRTFSALTARRVTGARKGRPFGKFWSHLAWSRVLTYGRALTIALGYIQKNKLQAEKRVTRLLAEFSNHTTSDDMLLRLKPGANFSRFQSANPSVYPLE